MSGSAFVDKKEVVLYFNSFEYFPYSEYRYKLGTGFFDFLSMPKNEYEYVFDWITQLEVHKNEIAEEEYLFNRDRMMGITLRYCPNLFYYLIQYYEFCKNFLNSPDESFDGLLMFVDDVTRVLRENSDRRLEIIAGEIDHYCQNPQRISRELAVVLQDAKLLMLEDIHIKKQRYQNDITHILKYRINDEVALEQCLYECEMSVRNGYEDKRYIHYGNPKIVDYLPYTTPYYKDGDSFDYSKSSLIPIQRIQNADDLLYLELISTIQNNLHINKCEFCGRYFTPLKRKDAKYCENPDNEQGKPCNKIGPSALYKSKKAQDPIAQAYSKAYNRMRSRYRNGKLCQQELYNWITEASEKRDACKDGEISLDEFSEWLDKG